MKEPRPTLRLLPAASIVLLLTVTPASAEDLIQYRRSDGSIGFTEDESRVPKGAVIVDAPDLSKTKINDATQGSHPSARPKRTAKEILEALEREATENESKPRDLDREDLVDPDSFDEDRSPEASDDASRSRTSAGGGASVEDRYNEERRRLRAEAERTREDAADTPCDWNQRRNREDCSERDAKIQAAEDEARAMEKEAAEIIDRCMEDDDCSPGQIDD